MDRRKYPARGIRISILILDLKRFDVNTLPHRYHLTLPPPLPATVALFRDAELVPNLLFEKLCEAIVRLYAQVLRPAHPAAVDRAAVDLKHGAPGIVFEAAHLGLHERPASTTMA